MKKSIFLIILTCISLQVFSQTESEIIANANELITNKKYESAFTILETYDTENEKPDIVLLKEKIALNYFVTSIMHQMFTFKDISIGENILDYRGKDEGTQKIHMFPVDEILKALIEKHPTNCRLQKGLGDYLFDFNLRYSNMYAIPQDSINEIINNCYQKAVGGKCADYMSYYVLGYNKISNNEFSESIPYFKQSIELDSTYPSSFYNLAYAFMSLDQNDSALKYAVKSMVLYEDTIYKGDAARMAGSIYLNLKEENKALEYYELSDKIDPDNYYTLSTLLYMYVKSDDPKTSKTLNSFYYIAPDHTAIYSTLTGIYFQTDKKNILIEFYKSKVSEFKNNAEVSGNLFFYLAQLYIDSDNKTANKYLTKAKKEFLKVYPKNHEVFNVIEEGLEKAK